MPNWVQPDDVYYSIYWHIRWDAKELQYIEMDQNLYKYM